MWLGARVDSALAWTRPPRGTRTAGGSTLAWTRLPRGTRSGVWFGARVDSAPTWDAQWDV